MSQNNNKIGYVEVQHSKKIMTSYSAGYLISDFMGAVLGVILFAFYETEIGLNTLMTGAALVIFAIWDAINDPVVGYFSDRPNRFTISSYFPNFLSPFFQYFKQRCPLL